MLFNTWCSGIPMKWKTASWKLVFILEGTHSQKSRLHSAAYMGRWVNGYDEEYFTVYLTYIFQNDETERGLLKGIQIKGKAR